MQADKVEFKKPRSARLLLALLICGLFFTVVYQYSENRKTTQGLRDRIRSLESKVGAFNDECETRIAVIKAETGKQYECPEPLDGRTLSEFISTMPPDFVNKLSADISQNITSGACGKLSEKAARKKRPRLKNVDTPAIPDDTPAEPVTQ